MALAFGCISSPDTSPQPQPIPCDCEADVVQAFVNAYRSRDHARLASLLAPEFTFYRDAPDEQTGELSWDRATELRIHQRMFDPASIPANDTPLADNLWLLNVAATLTPQSTFAERHDLYATASPPGPLEPSQWLVQEATYSINLFLELAGEDDYEILGRVSVVVITDLSKAPTDPGKFLLYRLEDLGGIRAASNATQGVIEASWTTVKEFYR